MEIEDTIGKYYYLRDYQIIEGRVNQIQNVFFHVLRREDEHRVECMMYMFIRYTENNHTYCYIGNTFADFNRENVDKYEEFRELSEEEYRSMTNRMLSMYEEINDQRN